MLCVYAFELPDAISYRNFILAWVIVQNICMYSYLYVCNHTTLTHMNMYKCVQKKREKEWAEVKTNWAIEKKSNFPIYVHK